MPFIERIVEPVHVSKVQVDRSITNELECVTNHTLANIIRQLSSLSQHAENMFAYLYRETHLFFSRAGDLNSRVEHLRTQVTQLNPTEEVVSLQDIHLRKPYKSLQPHDQQVVSRNTIPKAIQDLYNRCEKPPMLDKLNQYREDGRDCMKFYTDPNYFFELWYSEIQRDIEGRKRELKQKRVKKKSSPTGKKIQPRQLQSRVEKHKDEAMGKEFRNDYHVPNNRRVSHDKPLPDGYVKVTSSDTRTEDYAARHSVIQMEPLQGTALKSLSCIIADHREGYTDKKGTNVSSAVNSGYQGVNQSQNINCSQRQSQKVVDNCYNQSPRDMHSSQRLGPNKANLNKRPSVQPPLPIVDQGYAFRMDRVGMSPDRVSLPPPPPPPIMDESPNNQGRPAFESPHKQSSELPSLSHHFTQDTIDMPPPTLPPIHTSSAPLPAPLAPPPPPPPPLPYLVTQMNGVSVDDISLTSEDSSYSQRSKESEPEPTKLTGRNALLEEIRLGEWNKKLKKTEERQQARAPSNKFDVHSVMTKAFDMRRKAMEDSDSEVEMDEEEGDWD